MKPIYLLIDNFIIILQNVYCAIQHEPHIQNDYFVDVLLSTEYKFNNIIINSQFYCMFHEFNEKYKKKIVYLDVIHKLNVNVTE